MRITNDFPGGNIRLLGVRGDVVSLAVELRDTRDDWFYWAFRVCGAQGRTLKFDFSPKKWVGYFGAAVSHDLLTWSWGGDRLDDGSAFSYTFGPEENDVYFCHDLRYPVERFDALAQQLGLKVETLCRSEAGTPVPMVTLGDGADLMVLTARHHCCESTGSYVMEGLLSELCARPITGLRVVAIPFMDLDGAARGDQGKNREPHDHNRDYINAPIYHSTAALMALARANTVRYMFDLHSPWHVGGRNDVCFEVRKNVELRPAQVRFGELFEAETRADPTSFQYRTKNDLDSNCEWNTDTGMAASSTVFFSHRPGAHLVFSLETPYFGLPDNIVTQDNLVALGRCMARAIAKSYAEGV